MIQAEVKREPGRQKDEISNSVFNSAIEIMTVSQQQAVQAAPETADPEDNNVPICARIYSIYAV